MQNPTEHPYQDSELLINELSCNYWNILAGEIFKRNEFWGMYIEGRYWDSYIGGTADCLALVDYLAVKQKEEFAFLGGIFSDLSLDKLHGNFRLARK